MSIGMTYDQYWYGDVRMTMSYYKAYKLRQRQQNELAWLNGLYVYKAIETVAYNIMRGKNDKCIEYPREPIEPGEQIEKVETMSEDQQRVFARAYMMQMMEAGKAWGRR